MTELHSEMTVTVTTTYVKPSPGPSAVTKAQWVDMLRSGSYKPPAGAGCLFRAPNRDGEVWCITHSNYQPRGAKVGTPCFSAGGREVEPLAAWEAELLAEAWPDHAASAIATLNDASSDAALKMLRDKLDGTGMYGWFISYPDKPIGSTVLCAHCATDSVQVGKHLNMTRGRSKYYTGDFGWDGVERIRPVDPATPKHGAWCAAREWTCLSCGKRGWPL